MKEKIISAKRNNETFVVHPYLSVIERTHKLIKKELSKENCRLLVKYDQYMVSHSLAHPTRMGNLRIGLNLSRMLKKDWTDATKDDIDELVFKIVNTYGDSKGQETNSSYDHKKVLKIFFRWIKLGSRSSKEVGDPQETKGIQPRPVKNNLIREELVTSQDYRGTTYRSRRQSQSKGINLYTF